MLGLIRNVLGLNNMIIIKIWNYRNKFIQIKIEMVEQEVVDCLNDIIIIVEKKEKKRLYNKKYREKNKEKKRKKIRKQEKWLE